MKIKRNDPCHCGSGKKFKKCCINSLQTTDLESKTGAVRTPMKEVIQELGLPEHSEFVSYVVHLPNEDEFLSHIVRNEFIVNRAFSKNPELAYKFNDYHQAVKEAEDCKQFTQVSLLFDVGKQLIIAPV